MLACSESGSSIVAPSKTSKAESVLRRRVDSENLAKPNTTNRVDSAIKIERFPEFNFDTRLSAKTPRFMPVKLDRTLTKPKLAINRINDSINRVNAWLNDETRQDASVRIEPETVAPRIVQETKYPNRGVAKVPESAPGNADRETSAPFQSQTCNRAKQTLSIDNQDVNLLTYLDRQGRNEYITLASQIAYDGNNIAFVFYENQIRRLMEESPL